ncbi:MAG: hypothetical protein IKR12_00525 [Clostridia bacterium]|nr:hypothetical protein [Clostridia bacterium]
MVKNKKMSKTSIAVIVLALLLVFSLVMGMTGAWFTDKKTPNAATSLTFGEVKLNVTATDFGKVTRVSNEAGVVAADIMPGDTISYDLSIDGASGSEPFWFAVVVNTTGTEADLSSGLNALTTADIKSWSGSAVPCAGSVVLNGGDYDNAYQNQTVTLTYTVVAVQKANVADETAALPFLKAAVAANQHADGSAIGA